MIAAPTQPPALHMPEPHPQCLMLQEGKLLRGIVPGHRQMVPRRTKILPYRQIIRLTHREGTKYPQHLVHLLAHPHDDTRLGYDLIATPIRKHLRSNRLRLLQEPKRSLLPPTALG